ncbi:MAG: hypothetical protein JOZ42_08505 [Acetobacteraceae bacterium]|nr:hypothetical protein [Acetobacteraceae bacterium]
MTRCSAKAAVALLLLAGPAAAQSDAGKLPVPPQSPRIAEGEDYEHCLALLRNDPGGANAWADAWAATGGGEGALHCQALAQIALGNPQTGAEMLDKIAATSGAAAPARASLYGQAVQAWLMADDPARAFGDATLALALSPDDPGFFIDRSVAAATMDRYLDAIDDLDRALGLDPKRADALVLRAAAWRHEGRLDRAREDIDHAFALDPTNPDAFLERGLVRRDEGDREGARDDWRHAIALAPGTATADLAGQNMGSLDAGPAGR